MSFEKIIYEVLDKQLFLFARDLNKPDDPDWLEKANIIVNETETIKPIKSKTTDKELLDSINRQLKINFELFSRLENNWTIL